MLFIINRAVSKYCLSFFFTLRLSKRKKKEKKNSKKLINTKILPFGSDANWVEYAHWDKLRQRERKRVRGRGKVGKEKREEDEREEERQRQTDRKKRE